MLTIPKEYPRKWQHCNSQKGEQARSPLKAKLFIHLNTKEWKGSFDELAAIVMRQADEDSPAKLDLAKLLAANAEAAYMGYASTRNVKMPLKHKTVLLFPAVSDMMPPIWMPATTGPNATMYENRLRSHCLGT